MTGRYRPVMVLPEDLLPSDEQRAVLTRHIVALYDLIGETPERLGEAEAKMLAVITALMLAKPAAGTTEIGAQARAESYMIALEDIPWWAVKSAIRLWYRGECGEDERGKPYDYRWAPDTATLRRLAEREAWKVRGRALSLEQVITAAPKEPEPSEEHRTRMQLALRGLFKLLEKRAVPPRLTIDEAVKIGSSDLPVAQESPTA